MSYIETKNAYGTMTYVETPKPHYIVRLNNGPSSVEDFIKEIEEIYEINIRNVKKISIEVCMLNTSDYEKYNRQSINTEYTLSIKTQVVFEINSSDSIIVFENVEENKYHRFFGCKFLIPSNSVKHNYYNFSYAISGQQILSFIDKFRTLINNEKIIDYLREEFCRDVFEYMQKYCYSWNENSSTSYEILINRNIHDEIFSVKSYKNEKPNICDNIIRNTARIFDERNNEEKYTFSNLEKIFITFSVLGLLALFFYS